MSSVTCRYRVRATAEADPGALPRLLARFQNLNLTPRRVVAEFSSSGALHVEIDVAALPEATVQLIVTKLREMPCILDAHWCRP
jgi:hypothetical protein